MTSTSPALLALSVLFAAADLPTRPKATPGELSDAAAVHPDAAEAVKLVKIPKGLTLDVWATEPLVTNPVGFAFDERGRIYVAETFRYRDGGVYDNRDRLEWVTEAWKHKAGPERVARLSDELLDRDLSLRTVEERAAMIRELMDVGFMSRYADRVVRVEDRDGDGRADHAAIFADGFKDILDGVAASVLVRKGDVFFANVPHLWLLRDTDGDGKADVRKSLSHGYGVRYAFGGHDLHGLRLGPDGLLYFSMGDRGAHVKTSDGRTLAYPDTGAIFRCNLDGSNLEVFATGLRNPQDLVFDEHGNLFTADNNSDGGDKARWIYVVEGGDSGWRIGYQSIKIPAPRGPWNREKMWHTFRPGQPAFLLPAIANITNGPAGVTYYPGTGLNHSWARHFFVADFKGQANTSGVHTFTLKEKGAGFELVKPEKSIWGLLVTDVEFGWDGGLYLLDWVQGWMMPNKGRIYRLHDPAAKDDPDVASTKRYMAEGLAKRSNAELRKLLDHPDLRVRQEAQFQLVENRATGLLEEAAARGAMRVTRLHGIWGLGQVLRAARGDDSAVTVGVTEALVELVGDKDAEVRAQAVRVLGDGRADRAYQALRERLADPHPRVRFFAALAMGKLKRPEAVPSVLTFLRDNADRDPYLRHAGVMALAGMGDEQALLAAAADGSPAVRRAILLALRRLERPALERFLIDRDPSLVREAALAINDVPIEGAEGALARAHGDVPTLLRVVNANFRQGTGESAARLAALANRADVPVEVRKEALAALGDWGTPSGRDRVTGNWRPLPAGKPRDAAVAVAALEPVLGRVLVKAPDEAREAAARTAGRLRMSSVAPVLAAVVVQRSGGARGGPARVEALRTLAALKARELDAVLEKASLDPAPEVRTQALRIQVERPGAGAVALAERMVERGTKSEKQAALAALAKLDGEAVDGLLGRWLDRYAAGKFPAEAALDLLETAEARKAPAVQQKLAAVEAKRPKDELGPYREALLGGNRDAGRNVFVHHPGVQCLRCHVAEGAFGGEVGPKLIGIARKRNRQYLLEAVVHPNASFPPGFESVIVTTNDGQIHGGTVKRETALQLELVTPEGQGKRIAKNEIKTRERGTSGMPEGFGAILTKRELRDLVEYLASLK
jgi:quinoprotein glucose dehydrogenase